MVLLRAAAGHTSAALPRRGNGIRMRDERALRMHGAGRAAKRRQARLRDHGQAQRPAVRKGPVEEAGHGVHAGGDDAVQGRAARAVRHREAHARPAHGELLRRPVDRPSARAAAVAVRPRPGLPPRHALPGADVLVGVAAWPCVLCPVGHDAEAVLRGLPRNERGAEDCGSGRGGLERLDSAQGSADARGAELLLRPLE